MTRLRTGGILTALGVFFLVMAGTLRGVFWPGQTLFSNDGPLGQLMAECHRLPQRFTGCWLDLNSVGFNGGAASPSISFGLQWLLGPLWFSKLYAIISLVILALGVWCFLRELKLNPWACILGGLAASLNSTFFSVAGWGVGAHDITAGMFFFALAALADTSSPRRWLRVILAGMALGMAVTEGADVGAIFSVYAAAFLVYQVWAVEGPKLKNAVAGAGRLGLVVVCAVFLAAQSLHGLITTSIEGIKGAQQDAQTKDKRWDWATQWSLPKLEALNLIEPGLFGYRMDTLNEHVYWGNIGRDPAWDRYVKNGRQGRAPTGFLRFVGGGNYCGIPVLLVAVWAGAQSLRRRNSLFELPQRKWLWFWLAVAIVSLLLAFGRYAPFYHLVYALPYFSTIRNPTKYLYLFMAGVTVLFAYGVDGLWRRYMQPAGGGVASRWEGLQNWWRKAPKFDKAWVGVCAAIWLLSLLGWWIYSEHRDDLVGYLQRAQIGAASEKVADFSIQQAGWFAIVFFLAAGLMVLIFSGAFTGRHAGRGGFCLALLLVGDLEMANRPWIVYWDYTDKYASDPVVDVLKDKPYEHRVGAAPIKGTSKLAIMGKYYSIEWMQHQFPYYNIQSFDTVEMPRMPVDFAAFTAQASDTNGPGMWFHVLRAWQLTDTRYILAPMTFLHFVSEQPALAGVSLRPVERFDFAKRLGVSAVKHADDLIPLSAANGNFVLLDYADALPRAQLYSSWQINTNDTAALREIFDPAFDAAKTVVVAGDVPPAPANETDEPAGSVEILKYLSKDVVLKADSAVASILLLNDHYEPDWKVFVDGQRAKLLRCNFIMRGVQLSPGTHQVEFKFQPPDGWIYVSLAALVVTAFVGFLTAWIGRSRAASPMPAAAAPAPAAEKPAPSLQQSKGRRKAGPRKAAAGNGVVKR